MANLGYIEVDQGWVKLSELLPSFNPGVGDKFNIENIEPYSVLMLCEKSSTPDDNEGFTLLNNKKCTYICKNTNEYLYVRSLTRKSKLNIAEM